MLLGLVACDNGADYGDAIFLTGTLSSQNIRFLARNPKAFYFIWKNRKELFEKRDKATLLSKFNKQDIAELL